MSQSFKKPPFDDTFPLPMWIQYNARHSSEYPLFVYGSSPNEVGTITWSKAAEGIERGSRLVHDKLSISKSSEIAGAPQIIGILANLDSITYHTLFISIIRAGEIAFPISTRNSPAAVCQLLKATGTHKLFVSTDEQTKLLAFSALKSARQAGHQVDIFTAPTFDLLYLDSQSFEPLPSYPKTSVDSPALILHSSGILNAHVFGIATQIPLGSTAFPKAIAISHRMVMQWSSNLDILEFDMSVQRLAIHGLPVFHGLACCMVPWAARTGLKLTVFPPRNPPVVPSPTNLLESAISSRSTLMLTVPIFIELWSRDAKEVEKLKHFDGIVYGGGPLNKHIGDELWEAGVRLICFYGATEMGNVTRMRIASNGSRPEWDWIQCNSSTDVVFLPQEHGSDLFELVFVKCPTHYPAVINIQVDGRSAYATSDLVSRHLTDKTKFKIMGRKDDQIMLSNGEKTNPGPIEEIICRNPLVDAAVMFGRGRAQNGIIIQPTKENQIDPGDLVALNQYRNNIWRSVEQANAFAPGHSKLYKEMILIAHPSKPFERTAKLAPRRALVLEAYCREIEAAYNSCQVPPLTGLSPPSGWAPVPMLIFVRRLVHQILDKEVGDCDDIFQHGGDSLKATYLRHALIHALREMCKESSSMLISQDFVYANPSIIGLWEQLMVIVDQAARPSDNKVTSKLQKIEELVSEYSIDFPKHQPSRNLAPILVSGDIVLLTGSTGALGAQLLAHLVPLPHVSHVYALNRSSVDSKTSLRTRQSEALRGRNLDPTIVDSSKVTLVEGDITTPGLGINRTLLCEMRDSVTLIIHNAWRVNFNMKLGTFKPMIRSVRNLVDLALQSRQQTPPRFIFTSSVGVFSNRRAQGRPLEAAIDDPKVALGNGYSESKLVGERILENAAKCTPLRPIIVRIGQLTSNSGGAWNSGDWLPAIVRSGQVLGALPARDDSIAWMSLDAAAQAIVDFRTSDVQYLHLAHPRPAPWSGIFETFSELLDIPLVSWNEWLSKLEENSDGQVKNNPAVHLLDFFRGCSPVKLDNREALGLPLLDLTKALEFSPSLADPELPQLGRKDAERWVQQWKSKGFLSNERVKL